MRLEPFGLAQAAAFSICLALAATLRAAAQAPDAPSVPGAPAAIAFTMGDAILMGGLILAGIIFRGIEGRLRLRNETIVRLDLNEARAENARLDRELQERSRDLQKQKSLVQELEAKAKTSAKAAPPAPQTAQAPPPRAPEDILVAAAIVGLEEAARIVKEGRADADLRALDEAIGLGGDLAKAVALLETIRRTGIQALIEGLEQGGLDAALTSAALVRAYYPASAPWTRLAVALAAAESAVALTLERAGITIMLETPLSTVAAGSPEASPFGRTGLRGVARIRERASSAARSLPKDRALVVDCHAPGWRSTRHGTQRPSVTVFDPASWTA